LEKLVSQYCKLKNNVKAEYATKIASLLRSKGFEIENELFNKIAKMAYKIQGVELSRGNGKKDQGKQKKN